MSIEPSATSTPSVKALPRTMMAARVHRFGPPDAIAMEQTEYRVVASDVTGKVIADAGHWLMEEQPANTVAAIREFVDKQ